MKLDDIINNGPCKVEPEPQQPIVMGGRLTTAQTLLTLMQLGQQLENAIKQCAALSQLAPQQVADALNSIMTSCQVAKDKAAKLLAANK
jgi:hypothetical protein